MLPKPMSSPQSRTVQSSLMLSRVAMSRLRQRAEAGGMTETQLASKLLETIGPVRKFSQSFSGLLALRSKILSTVALANQASMQLRVAEDNVARLE